MLKPENWWCLKLHLDANLSKNCPWADHTLLLERYIAPRYRFLVAQMVENLPAMQDSQVRSLSRKDPLEKGMATHSSILDYRITCTEEPGRLYTPWGHKQLDVTEWLTHPLWCGSHGLEGTSPLCFSLSGKGIKTTLFSISPKTVSTFYSTFLFNTGEWRSNFSNMPCTFQNLRVNLCFSKFPDGNCWRASYSLKKSKVWSSHNTDYGQAEISMKQWNIDCAVHIPWFHPHSPHGMPPTKFQNNFERKEIFCGWQYPHDIHPV